MCPRTRELEIIGAHYRRFGRNVNISTSVVNFLPMASQTVTLNQHTDSINCSNKANNLNASYSSSSGNSHTRTKRIHYNVTGQERIHVSRKPK